MSGYSSSRTRDVINISHNAPTPTQQGESYRTAQDDSLRSVIEDSMKAIYRDNTDNTSTKATENATLYSDGQANRPSARLTATEATRDAFKVTPSATKTMNPVNMLLNEGATVHASVRPLVQRKAQKEAVSETNKAIQNSTLLSRPDQPTRQTSPRPQAPSRPFKTTAARVSVAKQESRHPNGGTSAVDALREKQLRQGMPKVSDKRPPTESIEASRTGNTKASFSRASRSPTPNTGTLAVAQVRGAQSNTRPVGGRSRSREKARATEAVGTQVAAPAASESKPNTAASKPSEPVRERTSDVMAKQHSPPGVPATERDASSADDASIFDVPASESEYEPPQRKPAKGRRTRKQAAKSTKVDMKKVSRSPAAPIAKNVRKRPGFDNKAALAPADIIQPDPSHATRPEAMARTAPRNVQDATRRTPAPTINNPRVDEEELKSAKADSTVPAEHAEILKTSALSKEVKGLFNSQSSKLSSDVPRDRSRQKLRPNENARNQPEKLEQGSTQNEAIVLSDHEHSSSSSSVAPVNPETRARATALKPSLPAAAVFSLPMKARTPAEYGHAPALVPETAQKLSLISFDKSGPRNQGSRSTKKGRPKQPEPSRGNRLGPDQRGKRTEEMVSTERKPTRGPPSAPVGILKKNLRKNEEANDRVHLKKASHRSSGPHGPADDFAPGQVDPEDSPRSAGLAMSASEQPSMSSFGTMETTAETTVDKAIKKGRKRLFSGNRDVENGSDRDSKRSGRPRDVEQPSERIVNGVQRSYDRLQTAAEHVYQSAVAGSASRKPTRNVSQGSQRVDMHGSPVPEGMMVPEESTVLETFSQQVNFSSDALLGGEIVSRRPKPTVNSDPTKNKVDLPPPRQGDPIYSSNSKAKPSAPQVKSTAISGHARLHAGQALMKDDAEMWSNNPFNGSQLPHRQPSQGSSRGNFIEHLRRAQAKAILQAKLPSEIDEGEDPDKTLVEPESSVEKPKRALSFSSDASTEISEAAMEVDEPFDDVAAWRQALMPHQMNLFDELVSVSHKLVRHLVDRETAAMDIVTGYHRRGLTLVEQMEQTHARQQEKYSGAMASRKGRLREELRKCSESIKENNLHVLEKGNAQVVTERSPRADVDELEQILADYC